MRKRGARWADPHADAVGHFGLSVNRGVAHADGKVFFGTLDGRLVALDAGSGRLVWSVQTTPLGDQRYVITGAPLAARGKVLIGNGGGDAGARGYVTAYDTRTGHQAWRFYTVPGSPSENARDPAMQMIACTWSGPPPHDIIARRF